MTRDEVRQRFRSILARTIQRVEREQAQHLASLKGGYIPEAGGLRRRTTTRRGPMGKLSVARVSQTNLRA